MLRYLTYVIVLTSTLRYEGIRLGLVGRFRALNESVLLGAYTPSPKWAIRGLTTNTAHIFYTPLLRITVILVEKRGNIKTKLLLMALWRDL